MTTNEIRDELARMAGFDRVTADGWIRRCSASPRIYPHPIPDTLEEAAKLPKGWTWWRGPKYRDSLEMCYGAIKRYAAAALYYMKHHERMQSRIPTTVPDTGDEKHDRFALQLECRRAERKEKA